MKIIDNFLSKENHEKIFLTFINNNFPWFYCSGVNFKNDGYYQFTHTFYRECSYSSDYSFLITPLIDKIKPLSLIKIKANLTVGTKEFIEYPLHYDLISLKENIPLPFVKNAAYYVNTNDGYTHFENNEKIDSIANRIVIFDNDILHGSTNCTDENCRLVININYISKHFGIEK